MLEGHSCPSSLLPGIRLVKTKEAERVYRYEYDPEVKKFLAGVKPDKKYLYVLVNALGAGEYYGANYNNDYFPEKELLSTELDSLGKPFGFKSFLSAGVYRDHVNARKNGIPFGDIPLAVYNTAMRRVELILRIDRAKALKAGHTDVIDKLDNGETVQVSMAVLVPYDLCSSCGNISRDPNGLDSCECRMGSIDATGKKVAMINVKLKFHDLSIVEVQGDSLGFAVEKVASKRSGPLLPVHALQYRVKQASHDKRAAKVKRIIAASARKVLPGVSPLPLDNIYAACCKGDESTKIFLSFLASHGIILSPAEFYAALASPSSKRLARAFFEAEASPLTRGPGDMMTLPTHSRPLDVPLPARRSIFLNSETIPSTPTFFPEAGTALQKLASRYNGYRLGAAKVITSDPRFIKLPTKQQAAVLLGTGNTEEVLNHLAKFITA